MVIAGLASFIMLPINLKYLGKEVYGISILATSFLTMFQFLSFGLSPTLLRFFSNAINKDDKTEIENIASTSIFILGGLGCLGAIIFLVSYPNFLSFYEIPKTYHLSLFILFLVMAFGFWETFYLIPFYALIQGSNRFDSASLNRIIAVLLRVSMLYCGYKILTPSLLVIALALLTESIFRLCFVQLLAFRLHGKRAFFQFKNLSLRMIPALFSFSLLTLIDSTCYSAAYQIPILIIGKVMDKEMVAAFYPAILFSSFFSSIIRMAVIPFVPLASKNAIQQGGNSLGKWSIWIGELVAFVAICLSMIVIISLKELIPIWIDDESLAWTSRTIVVLTVGAVIAAIQGVNYNLALGASTIVPCAVSRIVVVILTSMGTFLGTTFWNWSILQVAFCIAIVFVTRTVVLDYIYSRLFRYRFLHYIWNVYGKTTLIAIPFIILGLWLKSHLPFQLSMIGIIVYDGVFALSYLIISWVFVLNKELKMAISDVIPFKKYFIKR